MCAAARAVSREDKREAVCVCASSPREQREREGKKRADAGVYPRATGGFTISRDTRGGPALTLKYDSRDARFFLICVCVFLLVKNENILAKLLLTPNFYIFQTCRVRASVSL